MWRLLPDEPRTRRMVGAVNGGVTVHARPPEDELGGRPGEEAHVPTVRRARMDPHLVVALLAQPWLRDLQHLFVIRPVGIVTVRAALEYRRVLPEERAALFRVAGVAGVVQRDLLEQRGRARAGRVVARRARHLPLSQRHVREAHLLRLLLEVAGPARVHHVDLRELELRRDLLHDRVAIGARDVGRVVGAALPENAVTLGMARQADVVTLLDRCRAVLRERDESAHDLALRIDVHLAGAVTVLAPEAFLRIARVPEEETAHLSFAERLETFQVAFLAGFGAGIAVDDGGHREGGGPSRPRTWFLRGGARGKCDGDAEYERADAAPDMHCPSAWPHAFPPGTEVGILCRGRAVHKGEVSAPPGGRLTCAYCHQPDDTQAYMAPVWFAKHCVA